MNIGDFAEALIEPTTIVTKIMVYLCYVIGGVLLFTAAAQYRIHRQSPKLVPLTTPVMLVLFAMLLILLPYFSTLFPSGSALQHVKEAKESQDLHKTLGLPPLTHPRPKGPGRHWSEDPKYK